MNRKFTFLAAAVCAVASITTQAQVVNGEVAMGAGYANDVYYGLANQDTNSVDRADWDIAFYRKSNFSTGIRINDTKGIKVFEASNNISDWSSINASNIANWAELYNSDEEWQTGAFNNGSATYGWGVYNIATHNVVGSVIFVLQFTNGDLVKLKIDRLVATQGRYEFTYSKLVNGVWSEDQTQNLVHTDVPNKVFNYFNFETQQIVYPEPDENNWDLKFTKYFTPVAYNGGEMMYNVTGVLHAEWIKVAKTEGGNPTSEDDYQSKINTIGYNWKTYSGSNYSIANTNHFIKNTTTNQIYKLVFTAFEGSSTGVVRFNYENVTNTLGTTEINKNKIGIYSDTNKRINIVYNGVGGQSNKVNVQIFSAIGQLVHQENYLPSQSFTAKTLQLNHLPNGVYIVKLSSDDFNESKKVVLR